MTICVQKKQILFNDKNKYYPQVFSEEYFYEYTKCLEIIIMNLTAKNKSIKNEIYIYIYIYIAKKR